MNGDGKSCDLNRCFISIGGCAHTCAVLAGICSCNTGYILDGNTRSCAVYASYVSDNSCDQTCNTVIDVCSYSAGYVLNSDN